MIEEKLREYLQTMENPLESLKIKKDLIFASRGDNELYELLKNIEGKSKYETETMIGKYLNKKSIDKANDEKETISKVFGIDISEIEHKKLNNGKEIFVFYDYKYSRKRILENYINGESLTEYLKRIQNENTKYQSALDYKDNVNSMLNDQAIELDSELQMIYISDLMDYQKIINGLSEKERSAFEHLINQKDNLNLKYVNIQNCFAIDGNGNIVEAFVDEHTNKPRIEKPKEYSYNVNEIDNKEEIENMKEVDEDSLSTKGDQELNNNINYDDLEDIPNLVEAELATLGVNVNQEQLREIGKNIINYYKNPDQMIYLDEETRKFYEKFVSMLSNNIELKNENQMNLSYSPSSGFSTILIITILTIIIGAIILLVIR